MSNEVTTPAAEAITLSDKVTAPQLGGQAVAAPATDPAVTGMSRKEMEEALPSNAVDVLEAFATARTEFANQIEEGKPLGGDALWECTKLVKDHFDTMLVAEAAAYNSAEERHATSLAMGYQNALDWLSNREELLKQLVKRGLTPVNDDFGLLRQIAKLQLGFYKATKTATVWTVTSRRDERQGSFYCIFYRNPEKFAVETLRKTILTHKGKSGGILEAAKPKKGEISKEEHDHNYQMARKAAPLAKAHAPHAKWGDEGTYVLVLARVESHGLDIVEQIAGQNTLTKKLADAYTAKAALTVPSEPASEAE
ncbi:hypothetical protein DM806_20230 [Sphingobium lactosutens]|uniref:hypothetical protein n=1 Tax=Sphingobium lactosutens TaxID=522773 RepID=UPI0015BF9086|nr:hypothetical protein [Sphingobium lactosutens]NWK97944.1 hypothetical protein [Sphingobium lactosutens]